jgi:chromosome segregation ATPase
MGILAFFGLMRTSEHLAIVTAKDEHIRQAQRSDAHNSDYIGKLESQLKEKKQEIEELTSKLSTEIENATTYRTTAERDIEARDATVNARDNKILELEESLRVAQADLNTEKENHRQTREEFDGYKNQQVSAAGNTAVKSTTTAKKKAAPKAKTTKKPIDY